MSRHASGTIIKGVGGAYTVLAENEIYTCTARGIFRNKKIVPLVGDRVEIEITEQEKKIATLHTIKPRENELRRPPAANIGQVIITMATTQPDFNAGLLDRFLLLAEYENIPVLICINKTDLSETTFDVYKEAGYPLVYTCALSENGLDALREKMSGKVNLFAGPSGAGKSSLISALTGLSLETGEISRKLKRGKHTTRHTELIALGEPADGYCFDTPGFTSLDLEHIQKNELAPLFREFRPFLYECKFNNCMHIRETDCAVREQVGKAISKERYESYVKLTSLQFQPKPVRN
ncbi:MAG: ribosome small subunit-dependent GTPase A [Defluviitaleaceae bacterium]|nr:ribosome small subunit-dependent GTPase A [Defluviitaleaceae bacterium]